MAGVLDIVTGSIIGNYVLPAIARPFKTLYPHAFISIQIYNTYLAKQLIVERKVDLIFVEGETSKLLELREKNKTNTFFFSLQVSPVGNGTIHNCPNWLLLKSTIVTFPRCIHLALLNSITFVNIAALNNPCK